MANKLKAGANSKALNKRPPKSASSSGGKTAFSSRRKKTSSKPAATQHKPKPASSSLQQNKSKKPAHLRYTEKQLGVPQVNGIRPEGVHKRAKQKKGKQFVDDGSMRTILAMVMAEKEGNIESRMMRARQMEEIREARRAEAEKRAEGKRQELEGRKRELKSGKRSRPETSEGDDRQVERKERSPATVGGKLRKRVSFG